MCNDENISGSLIRTALSVLLVGYLTSAAAADGSTAAADGMNDAMHDAMQDNQGYTRSLQSYEIPDVMLRDRNGEQVELRRLLADQRPVLLQFIFTSCQSICPMLTAVMAQAQDELRRVNADTRIISISIDPEHDTPDRLGRYADKFGAQGDWMFLTGDWEDVRKTLKAFDAMYEGGNKMYHRPYTFMRRGPGDDWLRLIGVMGANKLVGEYRRLSGEQSPGVSRDLAGLD